MPVLNMLDCCFLRHTHIHAMQIADADLAGQLVQICVLWYIHIQPGLLRLCCQRFNSKLIRQEIAWLTAGWLAMRTCSADSILCVSVVSRPSLSSSACFRFCFSSNHFFFALAFFSPSVPSPLCRQQHLRSTGSVCCFSILQAVVCLAGRCRQHHKIEGIRPSQLCTALILLRAAAISIICTSHLGGNTREYSTTAKHDNFCCWIHSICTVKMYRHR